MSITIKRKEGEPLSSFLYRVSKRIQQSGILIEARQDRFYREKPTKRSKKNSAINRIKMERLIQKYLKQGYNLEESVSIARKILKDIIKK
jgi:ribosomal protein S21